MISARRYLKCRNINSLRVRLIYLKETKFYIFSSFLPSFSQNYLKQKIGEIIWNKKNKERTILHRAACFSLASDRSPDRRYIVQRIQDVSTKAKLNGSVGIQPFRPSATATLSARVPALSVHRSSSLSPFFVSLSKPLSLRVYIGLESRWINIECRTPLNYTWLCIQEQTFSSTRSIQNRSFSWLLYEA